MIIPLVSRKRLKSATTWRHPGVLLATTQVFHRPSKTSNKTFSGAARLYVDESNSSTAAVYPVKFTVRRQPDVMEVGGYKISDRKV